MRDPHDGLALALSEQVILTRTLGSADWQPVTLRAKGALRALALIAAPADLERYGLAPINPALEQAQVLVGLHDIPTTVRSAPGQASLRGLTEQLRDGYDILYLVAHGTLVEGEPWLFLDDEAGGVARVAAQELVARLADLSLRPRLILLASCQSVGDRSRSALTALGPRLAMAGIPAVIAMQGELSLATNAIFMPSFFRELRRDGQIDRALAQRLAARHRFPLAPFDRDDLPQVAQYLAVQQDVDFLREELVRVIHEALASQGAEGVGAAGADNHLAAVAAQRRAADAQDAHCVLAGLPFPIYLSASPDRLLSDALGEAGKAPQVRICPWNRHGELIQAPITPPTAEAPLVYHLFGRFDDPESLVLTEDDYFRYLIGVTRNEDLLPKVVGSALVNTALLFLGFRLDDWNFRVLFQSVMNMAGSELRRRYTHVAVQIDPQEGAMLDPAAAREYLKTYFGQAAALSYQTNISIYWGSAEDFVRELAEQYVRHQRAA